MLRNLKRCLRGTANTDMVDKTCKPITHFTHVLHSLNVDDAITDLFNKSTVESILCFSVTRWYGRLTKKDKHKLGKIVKKSKKLGIYSSPLDELYQEWTMNRLKRLCKIILCISKVKKEISSTFVTH